MIISGKTSIPAAQIKSLLSYAILAPSSHNTQPWRIEINDNVVSMFADRTRALPANDPDDRELTISCGCALMNLRSAAAHEGVGVTIDITPDPGNDDLLAVISFNKEHSSSKLEAGLFKSIRERRTYRKRFALKDVPTTILDSLSAAVLSEGSWLEIIESEEERQKVAELVSEGDSIQWSNPSWRRELAAWMHPRRRGDGLTIPGIVRPIAKMVVRTFDMGNRVGAKDKQLADESPVLAVLGSTGDNVADWLATGQALEKVLLSAHSQGLQASYLNQPIQVSSLRPKLQNLLTQQGFPENEIDAVPRRHLDEVIE
ncbi:MAG: Acg family FMN-binding oxidoreductase [Pseudomonadota bacterium]